MTFRDLHDAELPLLLPNAWDVASALAFVEAGFPAVATTSFGVAAGAGRADGARSSGQDTLDLVRRLAVLPAYVSADIEDGYHDDPDRVARFVASLGVAGINIEDSSVNDLISPELHAAKIAAIKRANPDVFVNARVDTYWLGRDANVAATLHRARSYVAAGADGIFVPGASDPADIRAITSNLSVPVNVLLVPALSLRDLGELGVRRVSTGSLPYRAAIDAAVEVARGVRDGREVPTATPYSVMQERLVGFERLENRATATGRPPHDPM